VIIPGGDESMVDCVARTEIMAIAEGYLNFDSLKEYKKWRCQNGPCARAYLTIFLSLILCYMD